MSNNVSGSGNSRTFRTRRRTVYTRHPDTHTSLLTAEEYRTKYLIGGNASHSRLRRYTRMVRREAKES